MARDIVFEHISHFIDALLKEKIHKVIFAVTNEKRSLQKEPGVIHVEHVDRVDVLGYKDSTIFKYTALNNDCDHAEKALLEAGFEISKRDRNIT